MDHRKLFQVLVLGGAILGTGCVETPPPARDDAALGNDAGASGDDAATRDDATIARDDAAVLGDDAATTTPGLDAGGLVECGFCPNDECCDGTSTREGLVCCWGTSC